MLCWWLSLTRQCECHLFSRLNNGTDGCFRLQYPWVLAPCVSTKVLKSKLPAKKLKKLVFRPSACCIPIPSRIADYNDSFYANAYTLKNLGSRQIMVEEVTIIAPYLGPAPYHLNMLRDLLSAAMKVPSLKVLKVAHVNGFTWRIDVQDLSPTSLSQLEILAMLAEFRGT